MVAPIKSLAFNLHPTKSSCILQKRNAVIETAVQKLGYREAKNLQVKSINKFVSGNNVFQCYQCVRRTRPYC